MLYSGQTIYLKPIDNRTKYDIPCVQISANKAKKLYDNGCVVWLHSCKMRVRNPYQEPFNFQKTESNETFESIVNSFKYYNCDTQRGKRVIFFAKVEDCK